MAEVAVKKTKKGDIIKVVLTILSLLMGIYIFVDPGDGTYKPNETLVKKIDSLESINKDLVHENAQYEELLDNYTTVISKLDDKVESLVEEQKNIRSYYNQKIKDLENAVVTASSLDSFFMSRYEYMNVDTSE